MDVNDLINDPMQALTKGWSLLSVGVGELSKVAAEGVRVAAQNAGEFGRYANENYVKPAQEQWNDPNFRNNVNGYVSAVTQKVRKLKRGRGIRLVNSVMEGIQFFIYIQ